MKSSIKLKFETSDSEKDTYSFTLNTANPDITATNVLSAMQMIVGSNAIEGVDLVAPLSAYIYNVTSTKYEFTE